jgi:hypothetical protein
MNTQKHSVPSLTLNNAIFFFALLFMFKQIIFGRAGKMAATHIRADEDMEDLVKKGKRISNLQTEKFQFKQPSSTLT